MVLGDLNARIGNEEVLGVMKKCGVPGRNVSGEWLLELCSELEVGIGNTFFKMKSKNKYTWKRIDNGRLVERAMMDYMLMEKSVLGRLVNVHVCEWAGGGVSDHFLVVAKVNGGRGRF